MTITQANPNIPFHIEQMVAEVLACRDPQPEKRRAHRLQKIESFPETDRAQVRDATSDAFGSWSDALQGFTEDQLARGVKACQDWRGDFPPNLGQFKGLCLTVRNERNFTEERLALEKQHGKPIESLEQLAREQANDSPVVRKAKAEMNAMLAGQDEFEFDGQTYRCQSKDAGMHNLGLNRRWTTVPQARQQDQPV